MGLIQTIENVSNLNGDIDLAQAPRRDLPRQKINGPRTTALQVIVRQSALNKIHAHGDSSPAAEICGVLVGNVYQDATSPFLHIEHIIQGEAAASSAGQVTFTADTWQHIQEIMDRDYSDLRIVGWYHTHPGHGVFLSEMDIFLHESFFGLPWQTALVYDPRTGDEGFFGSEAKRARRMPHLIESDEPKTATLSQAGRPSGELETAPVVVPHRAAVPLMRTRKRRRTASLGRMLLAIIGLFLFAAMGVLIGLAIRTQGLQLPEWIQRMSRP
ncbi:MAG TPA: Mov34/MPN/PAD-1 family protein [Tepidisphaeraceae bacterium]|jgi:proteasome lid subunit RPN8/RPN11